MAALASPLIEALSARREFRPKPFGGPALEAAVKLDSASPNYLSSVLHASACKRQAHFLCFAQIDWDRPQVMVARLRAVTRSDLVPAQLDPLAQTARLLVLLKPKAIVEAVFGSAPDGFVGLLARLGDEPLVRSHLYTTAFRLFADPQHRQRAKLLSQIPGKVGEARIEIVEQLDAVLCRPRLLKHVYERSQLDGLHQFLGLIRITCDATDQAIAESLDQLGQDGTLQTWAERWLRRMVRLPVASPIPDSDPDFRALFGGALLSHGRAYRNCGSDRLAYPMIGRHAFFEWVRPPGPGCVIQLSRLSEGRWVLDELRLARNAAPDQQTAALIRERLRGFGVLFPTSVDVPGGRAGPLKRLLGVWDWEDEPLVEDAAAPVQTDQRLTDAA